MIYHFKHEKEIMKKNYGKTEKFNEIVELLMCDYFYGVRYEFLRLKEYKEFLNI